jgi:general secretion pathway protein D
MEIKQKISNEVDAGGTSAVSPSVFERSINTEVIAQSGQTIILGGLISNNSSQKESKVPFLGDLPLIGALFRAQTQSGDKTELVIFVTPKVIESSAEWQDITNKFQQGLMQMELGSAF